MFHAAYIKILSVSRFPGDDQDLLYAFNVLAMRPISFLSTEDLVKYGCKEIELFAFVTRRPYCPWRPKKLCFTTQSLAPTVLTARLCVVKQSFFGLQGQYGGRVTKANCANTMGKKNDKN